MSENQAHAEPRNRWALCVGLVWWIGLMTIGELLLGWSA